MSWNYRIIEHEDRFGLHVVHYNEDGSLQSFRPASGVTQIRPMRVT